MSVTDEILAEMAETQTNGGSKPPAIVAESKPPKEERPAPLAVVKETAVAKVGIAPPAFAMPRTIADIQTIGKMMVASGFFKDVKTEAQACVKIIAGAALGYDPFTSLNAFHIIEGKVTPTAGEIGARIKRSGKYNYTVKHLDDNACTLVFLERDGKKWLELGESTFTKQDAIVAGVAGKTVWKSYFRNMVFSRALTNGVRWYCPDLFGGPVYTPEELGANVEIVEGEMVVVDAIATPPEPPVEPPPTSAEIKALYGDARKVDPSLPERVTVWAPTVVHEFTNPPKVEMLVALRARLREILAGGVTPPEGSKSDPAPVVEGEYEPAPQNQGASPALFDQAATSAAAPSSEPPAAPASTESPQTPVSSGPPAPGGGKMTLATQKRLFATLKELGITSKADRLSYAGAVGIAVTSYSDLDENRAIWLADEAHRNLVEARKENAPPADGINHGAEDCPACMASPGDAHASGCPEAEPAQ